ncbi:hypothetical protein [Streptomyces syringium]|uniref:hypothetical protein n=1 Tax=Streptomyces syringium TaxID=76729 RepID=UPI003456BF7D
MGRPKSNGETPKHNVRVPDDVWTAAKERAKKDHTNVSAVIVTALRQYAAQGTIPLSDALASQLIKHADKRAATQRHILISDELLALTREKAMDAPAGPVFPRRVQMTKHIAGGKVLLDSAEVTRLLRALGGAYRSPALTAELDQIADELDMAALTALDGQ